MSINQNSEQVLEVRNVNSATGTTINGMSSSGVFSHIDDDMSEFDRPSENSTAPPEISEQSAPNQRSSSPNLNSLNLNASPPRRNKTVIDQHSSPNFPPIFNWSENIVIANYSSGFDDECACRFPSLELDITFTNGLTLKRKCFKTTVLVLDSPIDLIIGRSSLKLHKFSIKTPSHFEVKTNLKHTQSKEKEFDDSVSQDLYVQQAAHIRHLKGIALLRYNHAILKIALVLIRVTPCVVRR